MISGVEVWREDESGRAIKRRQSRADSIVAFLCQFLWSHHRQP